jgi:hypothetical protein
MAIIANIRVKCLTCGEEEIVCVNKPPKYYYCGQCAHEGFKDFLKNGLFGKPPATDTEGRSNG